MFAVHWIAFNIDETHDPCQMKRILVVRPQQCDIPCDLEASFVLIKYLFAYQQRNKAMAEHKGLV